MHDTVKKKITHDIGQKCKHGDDLAESLEKGKRHETKDKLFDYLGFAAAPFAAAGKPTSLELIEYMEYVKEKNKRFRVYQDNCEKAFSMIH